MPRAAAVSTASYSRLTHWLAISIAVMTVPLILIGGEVTSRGAGLSVPDWPNSYGYNMFLFPVSRWVGGILYEHSHRLIGTVVGMLAIAFVAAVWIRDSRRWVKWLSVVLLGTIILQGVLGGLRVVWKDLDLAIVHACLAQATFCFMGLTIAVTSKWWTRRSAEYRVLSAERLRAVIRLAAIATALIYLQLIVGAITRHYEAGLAIPDLPLTYGKWLPPTRLSDLEVINAQRAWYARDLPRDQVKVTLDQIWIHFLHRIGAVLVTVAVAALVGYVLIRCRGDRRLAMRSLMLAGLILTQLTLGVLVVLMRRPFEITSFHVVVGAVTLFTTFYLAVRAIWLRHSI